MRAKYKQIISCVRREHVLLARREKIDQQLRLLRSKLNVLLAPTKKTPRRES